MPLVEANGISIQYQCEGPTTAPVLAFSNSLGTNFFMWEKQVAQLKDKYRVLRYDTRGHGGSSVPEGPYSIELLAADFVSLMNALSIDQCYFCGLSMGGMIGLWLAISHPNRLKKLVVANSAAKIGTVETWNQRIAKVRNEGMTSVALDVIARWFTPQFREQHPEIVSRVQSMLESTDIRGYSACCEAIRDMDQRAAVGAIELPTLVISGESDPVTPPTEADALVTAIAGAKHVRLQAAHLSNIESADEFTNALAVFLEDRNV